MEKNLVVAVHDFSPAFKSQLEEIIKKLDSIGVNKRSILVIPNYKGRNYLEEDPEFLDMLKKEVNEGNEICLHGYTHSNQNGFKREFRPISLGRAKMKLEYGKTILNRYGARVEGFVPPYWKLSIEDRKREVTGRVLAGQGFRFYVRRSKIVDLRRNKEYGLNLLQYLPSYPLFNSLVIRPLNEIISRTSFLTDRMVHVALHPHDLLHPNSFRHGVKMLYSFLENGYTLTSYLNFLNSKSPERPISNSFSG